MKDSVSTWRTRAAAPGHPKQGLALSEGQFAVCGKGVYQ